VALGLLDCLPLELLLAVTRSLGPDDLAMLACTSRGLGWAAKASVGSSDGDCLHRRRNEACVAEWRALGHAMLPSHWHVREWRLPPPLAFSLLRPSLAVNERLWHCASTAPRRRTAGPASPDSRWCALEAEALLPRVAQWVEQALPRAEREAQARLLRFLERLPARALRLPPGGRARSRVLPALLARGLARETHETEVLLLVLPPPRRLCLALMLCAARCPSRPATPGAG